MSRRRSPIRVVPRALLVAGVAVAALGVLGATTPAARAQVLDVEPAGAGDDDLRFTWTGGTDDLLRGPSPDALAPWLTMVDSPLVVPGENALGTGDAWYRLASGSNMAFRLERNVVVDAEPLYVPLSLPERRADVTGCEVLGRYPAASQVTWYDAVDRRLEGCGRVDGMLLGDDEPLPPHGGALLTFTESTTIRLVGSSDPSVTWRVEDVPDLFEGPPPYLAVLGVPANARLLTGFELLCGERGVDWVDADGDTVPEECGLDTDGDGFTDTGAWTSVSQLTLTVQHLPDLADFGQAVGFTGFIGNVAFDGDGFVMSPGEGLRVEALTHAQPPLNDGYRPPTW